ncbi:hypothetical protein BDW75DRAFT_242749 [Aspergillus navahoensis]
MLMFIPNGAEFCLMLWTAFILHVMIVCLDEEMLNVERHDELRRVLKTIRPRVIVVQDRRGADVLDITLTNLPLDPNILKIALSESEGSEPNSNWRSLLSLSFTPTLSASATESLLSAARMDPSNAARTQSILYTSGTSGVPKVSVTRPWNEPRPTLPVVAGQRRELHASAATSASVSGCCNCTDAPDMEGCLWPFDRSREIPFYGEMSPVGTVARGAAVRISGGNGTLARGVLGELHVCCTSIIPGNLVVFQPDRSMKRMDGDASKQGMWE